MRKAMLFLAVFALANSLWAADPIIGTWKLNIAKSTFPSNAPPAPKEQIEAYRHLDTGEIELTYRLTEKDGSSVWEVFTWPAQGGAAKMIKGDIPKNISWIQTLIAPGEWYVTAMEGGKQIGTRHKTVSSDGKRYRQSWKRTDAQGKPYEIILVFDRQ
jgi:hypothetical protein